MSERAVQIRGLTKAFGDHRVLRGVDLDVDRGENVVVLGKSGTGKSVLIKILVGLLSADSGSATVLGQDVMALRPRELDALRLRIGFSFQHSALYDSMDVQSNLEFPLRMTQRQLGAAEIATRVDEALEAVGLSETRRQLPAELSGGQRKRIGMARALILRPEVMLYDEPTAGLDPLTSAEINQLILEVRERYHTAAILITHDLTCAKDCGDRVAMLLDGRIARQGTFDEVFAADDPQIQAFYDYNFVEGHERAPRAGGVP